MANVVLGLSGRMGNTDHQQLWRAVMTLGRAYVW